MIIQTLLSYYVFGLDVEDRTALTVEGLSTNEDYPFLTTLHLARRLFPSPNTR
jgi:hypothetical protein